MKVHFEKALARLEELLKDNAERVQAAVKSAVKAVQTGNVISAQAVSDGDQTIDLAENLIEEECLEILALYQPVAADLRRVATILKANGEIERAGDLATGIANRVADMASSSPRKPWDFTEIASGATAMFSDALKALATDDAELARKVIDSDDRIDELHKASYTQVAQCLADQPSAAAYYLSALTVSRCLERLADLATNIAEDVVYLQTAEIVRHRPVNS